MKKSMIIKEEVVFKAKPEQVWDLLVNPAMTKQYMFGCEVVSDWKVGSSILWKGATENGEEVVYVKGEILEYQEGRKITSTTFDPNSDMADVPANYVNLTYEINTVASGTLLTILQGDFSKVANGDKRYEDSKSGWSEMVIPVMKKLLGE